jgi:UDP-N-acetyl-D-galactosamine dehydrogenase
MKNKISVIGLGYVGLPLAIEFAKQYKVVGFDINKSRVKHLENGEDKTLEVSTSKLNEVIITKDDFLCNHIDSGLFLSSNLDDITDSCFYIITVPTPIDNNRKPDLSSLLSATKMVAKVLEKGDIVIYESTVFPGCTEENCIPVLEQESSLIYNKDFFCGYSPERISPGDKVNTLTTIKKVTSGSTPKIAIKIDNLYKSIIKAGTYLASSIKVAGIEEILYN